MSEQWGLSYLNHPRAVEQLAPRCGAVIQRGGEHLLAPGTLRAMMVTVLLDMGVRPHEVALDRRMDGTTVPLWLELDSGIGATMAFVHPIRTAGSSVSRQVTRLLTGMMRVSAHEHLTLALLPVEEHARLWEGLPMIGGHEAPVQGAAQPGPGHATLTASCVGAAAPCPGYRLVMWQVHENPPDPRPVTNQPRLFTPPAPGI